MSSRAKNFKKMSTDVNFCNFYTYVILMYDNMSIF